MSPRGMCPSAIGAPTLLAIAGLEGHPHHHQQGGARRPNPYSPLGALVARCYRPCEPQGNARQKQTHQSLQSPIVCATPLLHHYVWHPRRMKQFSRIVSLSIGSKRRQRIQHRTMAAPTWRAANRIRLAFLRIVSRSIHSKWSQRTQRRTIAVLAYRATNRTRLALK